MSGWIMWALTTVFRELGVIREGMETIAAPIELTDVEGATSLKMTEGRIDIINLTQKKGIEINLSPFNFNKKMF